jgi:hypothetical protein
MRATKEYGSSWIFEPCLTWSNALRRVQHPGFSLVAHSSRLVSQPCAAGRGRPPEAAARRPALSSSRKPSRAQWLPCWTERNASMLPASRPSHRWSCWLLAQAPCRPGRGRRRPTEARSQLLGHDLHDRPCAAILSGPSSLLEPSHDHDPAALREGLAACSAWSRHTITVKNDASCSRRPDTATRNTARAIPSCV